jgi:hypothetical protein
MFLNAPKSLIKDNEECKAISKFIQTESKCGKKIDETFVINYQFWDQQVSDNGTEKNSSTESE